MFLLMICRSKKNFFFKELKFFEKEDHIFRNQRDSKIYSFYFDVKVNPITFSATKLKAQLSTKFG